MAAAMLAAGLAFFTSGVDAYSRPVDHRAIAGLWKLTQKTRQQVPRVYPLKEFTVVPRDRERQKKLEKQLEVEHEMLLMLKEDGSFQQYDDNEEDEIPDKLQYHKSSSVVSWGRKIKGQWDLVDGKLILAADRPVSEAEDTLLVGEVVAKSEQSLAENPMLKDTAKDESTKKTPDVAMDTHLSIPKGEVNVGKFFYPRHHPSFFEQPMFRPTPTGKFALKQVLGSLNAQNPEEEDELIELFRDKDFHDKRFLLTSHPLANKRPKGNIRWSIKYNKFVEDPPSQKAKKRMEEEENRPVNIRVMEVMFFANNTFATVGGLGDAITLRGKYHIVGNKRDQLWMQVWRFGFGRSVSGSVFSEGRTLTKEDEKTYWGKICYEDELEQEETSPRSSGDEILPDVDDTMEPPDNSARRLYIKGSVLFGYGLEPQPVGRFIMTETEGSDEDDLDDDEEDEEEDDDNEDPSDEFLDWSNAFQ